MAWNVRIRKRCAQLNWTQQDLADEINARFPNDPHVTQSMISHWTRLGKGRSTFPPYERMRQVAAVLDVEVAYLTGEIDGGTHLEQSAMEYLGLRPAGVKGIQSAMKAKDVSGRKRRRLMLNALFSSDSFASGFADALESYVHNIRLLKYYRCKSAITARILPLGMSMTLDMHRFNVLKQCESCLSEMKSKLAPTTNSLLDEDGRRLLAMQKSGETATPELRKLEREYLREDIRASGAGEWIKTYMMRALQELAEDEEWVQETQSTPWECLVAETGSEDAAWDFLIDILKETLDIEKTDSELD